MLWLQKNWIPLVMAAFLYLLLVLSIPINFNPFEIIQVALIPTDREQILLADIDGDGSDDIIDCGGNEGVKGVVREGLTIRTIESNWVLNPIDQLNVPERFRTAYQAITADLNNNGKDEIYAFGVIEDSIFMYCYEYPELKSPFRTVFIDTFVRHKGFAHLQVYKPMELDVNSDGVDELYFSIRNSYPIYPRRIYRYELTNDSLIRSPFACFYSTVQSVEKTPYGSYIIGSSGSGSDNYKDTMNYPFPDTASYSVALNENLEFLYKPKEVGDWPGSAITFAHKDNLYTIVNTSNDTSLLLRLSHSGRTLDRMMIVGHGPRLYQNSSILMLLKDDSIFLLDENLNTSLLYSNRDLQLASDWNFLDLNGDGKEEFLFHEPRKHRYTIVSSDFKHKSSIDNFFPYTYYFPTIREVRGGKNQLMLHTTVGAAFFEYRENNIAYARIPYHFFLLILASLISFTAFGYFRRNLERTNQRVREMNRVQMLAVKNQIDPHFTLNALNSIDAMYQKGESIKASNYMVKFSRLIHQTLMSSDKVTCSIEEELQFIRNYCELEKYKSQNGFEFEIDTDQNIDLDVVMIPRHLVFTYVENAIKHGLRPVNSGAFLNIIVHKQKDHILIRVMDNGAGFNQAVDNHTSGTRKGLNIAKQLIQLYHKMNLGKVHVEIVANHPQGVKVDIKIGTSGSKRSK